MAESVFGTPLRAKDRAETEASVVKPWEKNVTDYVRCKFSGLCGGSSSDTDLVECAFK